MATDLLLELGTEEIPYGALVRALGELAQRGERALHDARLGFESVKVYGTPRRIAFVVDGLSARQADLDELVVGPPERVAFAADGTLTQAGQGFAQRNGVDPSTLSVGEVAGKKGRYVHCRKLQAGQPAMDVLPALLRTLIVELPWPKSMRWGFRQEAFVRPLHWIVALFGEEVVPVEFAGVRSGRQTRGHRFMHPAAIEIARPSAYIEALRAASVLVVPEERKDKVRAELAAACSEAQLVLRSDEALLNEVTYLVEYPFAVCGSFDAEFLAVPSEVIVSAMRAHQRYFALEGEDGRLANRFITIAGTRTKDMAVVRAGNERVLAARLSDAAYFFREDKKTALDVFAQRLDGVVFQAKIGTIGQKARRVAKLAARLAEAVGVSRSVVERAGALAKADLVSHMVSEFPDLQGVMGRYYARAAGESEDVALAIAEHYLPRGASDSLPTSEAGAVLAIADRIDTLLACFAVGLVPSGSADPYGLRRAALGVLSILQARNWSVGIDELLRWAGELLTADGVQCADERRADLEGFVRTRLRVLWSENAGLPADCVEAALRSGFYHVADAFARAQALAKFAARADYETTSTAIKRIANILKDDVLAEPPSVERFREEAERALWAAYSNEAAPRAAEAFARGAYGDALDCLLGLKPVIDGFFDKVMVMDEDLDVRRNRLALLSAIHRSFAQIGDFRQLGQSG